MKSLLFIFFLFVFPFFSPPETPQLSAFEKYNHNLVSSLKSDLAIYSNNPYLKAQIEQVDWEHITMLLDELSKNEKKLSIVIAGQLHVPTTELALTKKLEQEIKFSQDMVHSLLISIGKDIDPVMVEGFNSGLLTKQEILNQVRLSNTYRPNEGLSYDTLSGSETDARFEQAKALNAVYRVIENTTHQFRGTEEPTIKNLDISIKLLAYHFATPSSSAEKYFTEVDKRVGTKIRTLRSLLMLSATINEMDNLKKNQAILIVGVNHLVDFGYFQEEKMFPNIGFQTIVTEESSKTASR